MAFICLNRGLSRRTRRTQIRVGVFGLLIRTGVIVLWCDSLSESGFSKSRNQRYECLLTFTGYECRLAFTQINGMNAVWHSPGLEIFKIECLMFQCSFDQICRSGVEKQLTHGIRILLIQWVGVVVVETETHRFSEKISCRLTLNDTNADLEVLATYGLAGFRRHRLLRLTKEAYDQDALLNHEDLAVLLTTSPATVKRDIRHLKQNGYFVMTRKTKHDMGPGTSHKTQILELYFKDYTFTEIEKKN